MDLNNLEIPETAEIHLEFPGRGKLHDEQGNPVTIEVYGPSSDVAIAHRRKVMKEAQSRFGRGGMKSLSKISPEEIDEKEIDRLVAMTSGVNNLTYKGEEVSPDNIRSIYENPKMGWLTDQVRERLGSWEDFLA